MQKSAYKVKKFIYKGNKRNCGIKIAERVWNWVNKMDEKKLWIFFFKILSFVVICVCVFVSVPMCIHAFKMPWNEEKLKKKIQKKHAYTTNE